MTLLPRLLFDDYDPDQPASRTGSGNMSSKRKSYARRAVSDFVAIIYTGIDYHKRYSVACTFDAQGQKPHEARAESVRF